jgi:hypothetical protein
MQENISFDNQYKFVDCKNIRPLPFDFAVFNAKHCLSGLIEFHGEQHYKPSSFGGNKTNIAYQNFNLIQTRDLIKTDYCNKHKIPLLTIPYWEKKNIKSIITSFIGDIL